MYGYGATQDVKYDRLAIRSKTLASMLAQENIRVEFKSGIPTAYFDSRSRTLAVPNWDLKNRNLVDMIITHEVGHAIYSDFELGSLPSKIRSYVNILEDVRVDRKQRENYPGTKKDYFEAGKAMIELDVFKLGELDIPEALLIDRINLKSKLGLHIGIPFYGPLEKDFVARAFKTETVEEVIALAWEIFEYDKEKREEEKKKEEEKKSDSGNRADSVPAPGGESEEGEEHEESEEAPNGMPQSGNNEAKTEEKKEETTSSENGEAEKKDAAPDAGKEEGEKTERDAEKSEEDNNSAANNDKKTEPKEDPKSKTADALDEFERNANKANLYRDNCYMTVGDYPTDTAFLDPVLFREEVKTNVNWTIENVLAEKEKKYRDSIALLRKEFAVHRFARSTTSLKTLKGRIDTNALCLYKIRDNIFQQTVSVEKNDNNHRVVFLMDNSGSMYSNKGIETVLDQIVVFRRFCLEEKIPFHVITFTSPGSELFCRNVALAEWRERQKKFYASNPEYENKITREQALLIEVLNEKDDNAYFNKLIAYFLSMRRGSGYSDEDASLYPQMTPTNEALSRLYKWMVELKKTMREDKLNLVILTDGDSTDRVGYAANLIVRDAVTGREYGIGDVYERTDADKMRMNEECMTGFVVLKSLKEMGVLHSVVWYNYLGYGKFYSNDFGHRAIMKLGQSLNAKATWLSKAQHAIRMHVKKEGVVYVPSPLPFIDASYFFLNPEIYCKLMENETFKDKNREQAMFRANRKAASIFKTLASNVGKFLG